MHATQNCGNGKTPFSRSLRSKGPFGGERNEEEGEVFSNKRSCSLAHILASSLSALPSSESTSFALMSPFTGAAEDVLLLKNEENILRGAERRGLGLEWKWESFAGESFFFFFQRRNSWATVLLLSGGTQRREGPNAQSLGLWEGRKNLAVLRVCDVQTFSFSQLTHRSQAPRRSGRER